MANNPLKVLCLSGCLLGNKTVTALLKETLNSFPDLTTEYIFLENADYTRYPVPRWKKAIGQTSEILHIIHQKIKDVDFSKYDLVIVQGYEIGWAVNKRVKDIPCLMLNDATPTSAHEMMRGYRYLNSVQKFRSALLLQVYRIFFRNIFSNIDLILPQTTWCGDLLKRDFNLRPGSVGEPAIAVDTLYFHPSASRVATDKLRLLFVGNDFQRKGGYFLLELYERIKTRCTLTIVSEDDFFKTQAIPPGIIYKGKVDRAELVQVFQEAEVFLFPTYKEHFGMVQLEALACGLVLLSRDVGGVKDAVVDGHNGFLMPYDSAVEDWVKKIEYLIANPAQRARMGQNSRKLAEERFSQERFRETIAKAISGVKLR